AGLHIGSTRRELRARSSGGPLKNRFVAATIAALFLLVHAAAAQAPSGEAPPAAKKILFLAGPRDHGAPGRHEYERDLKTLAQSLEQSSNLRGDTTQLIVGTLRRVHAAWQDAASIVIGSDSDHAAYEAHPLFPPNPSTNGRGY